MVPYSKPYKTASDLVTLLQVRGLAISDTLRAERYISNIGYYRLSAYMFPFLLLPKTDHKFKVGVSFDNVLDLYRFDKKLRVLIFNEVEKLIAFIFSNVASVQAFFSPHSDMNSSNMAKKSGSFGLTSAFFIRKYAPGSEVQLLSVEGDPHPDLMLVPVSVGRYRKNLLISSFQVV